jgi:hypothetical protein
MTLCGVVDYYQLLKLFILGFCAILFRRLLMDFVEGLQVWLNSKITYILYRNIRALFLLIFVPVRDKHQKYGTAREAKDVRSMWWFRQKLVLHSLTAQSEQKSPPLRHTYFSYFATSGFGAKRFYCISHLSHTWDLFAQLHSPLLLGG